MRHSDDAIRSNSSGAAGAAVGLRALGAGRCAYGGPEPGARGLCCGLRLTILGLCKTDILIGGVGLCDEIVQHRIAIGFPPALIVINLPGSAVFHSPGSL